MKAYYNSDCRSDKVIQDHLLIEWEPYKDAKIVICTGDRISTFNRAFIAFTDNKYIIHYFAGIKNTFTTYDDTLRHCITLMSNEQWVENKKCAKIVKKLCKAIGKEPNIKIVGSNYLNGVELDYSKVPGPEKYNLVLYNPCTKIKEIFIGPNPDITYANLPQEQFLALVKECEKFLTNSSCGVYEAPFLIEKEQIVWLGKRNRGRKYVRNSSKSKR